MADAQVTQHPAPTALIAGDAPRRFMTVTIESGQDLEAGAVLGEVTASEEFKLSASDASDGSETPSVVLWEDVDASEGAVDAEVLIAGDVRGSELSLGDGHTVTSVRKALRTFALFVH